VSNRSAEIEFAQAIDTEYVEQYVAYSRLAQRLRYAKDKVRKAAGQKHDYRKDTWDGTFAEALNGRPVDSDFAKYLWDPAHAEYLDLDAQVRAIVARMAVLGKIYGDHGWSRFFLVTNSNGHIHSSTSCSTCFPTTEFAWLPGLSGLTEADAVEDQGEILCSVCFPSAPVAWTNGTSKVDQAAKAERAAAKAEREAKKAAKALVPTDIKNGLTLFYVDHNFRTGEPRTYRRHVATIAQAKTFITDCAAYGVGGEEDERSQANLDLVLATYAERIGSTVEAEWSAARKRVAKRR
jgi:hypothetical protein